MRILWVSHSGELTGGAERALLEAARSLVATGVEVQAVLTCDGELGRRLQELGITVRIIPYTWWVSVKGWRRIDYRLKRLGRNIYFGKQLSNLLSEIKPDLVVSNTLTVAVGAFAAKWAGIPHVWYVHELFGREGHGLYFDWGQSLSLFLMNRLSARVIVNSKAVLENLEPHIPLNKLRLVYYAVQVPPRLPTANEKNANLRLIQVGILSPGKRPEDAIRALASLVKKNLNVHLTLLGTETLECGKQLRDLSRELAVPDRVDFVAFADDPFGQIAKADVVLTCSRGEGFGRVTVEAMKLGKPVIGANSGGTTELISDGNTGLFFQVGDAEDLERKIEILYHDRQLMRQIGLNAQAWATRTFSLENYSAGLLSVFEETTKEDLRAADHVNTAQRG